MLVNFIVDLRAEGPSLTLFRQSTPLSHHLLSVLIMPKSKRPSLAPFLALLVFFSLTLFHYIPPKILPPHEPSLVRTIVISNSTFKVSTLRNRRSNRCAVIYCTPPSILASLEEPSCDLIFLEMQASPKVSPRLCPILYINSQWDAVSTTYNHGFVYTSKHVALRHRTPQLPLDSHAVHFPVARNNLDIAPLWFSVWPSNATKLVFTAWAREAAFAKPDAPAPEHASLNRARSCHAPDVVCHPRRASLAWTCDGSRESSKCQITSSWVIAARMAVISMTVVFSLAILLAGAARAAARLRVLTSALSAPVSMRPTVALLAVGLIALVGEDWPVIVQVLARIFSVSFKQKLDTSHVLTGDLYRAVPELRGVYEGYSYVYRDGNFAVWISGPGVSMVVGLSSVILFLKRVLFNGLLVKCVFWILVIKSLTTVVCMVAVHGKKDVGEEEDEYYRRRTDFAQLQRPRQKSRSFLLPRGSSISEFREFA